MDARTAFSRRLEWVRFFSRRIPCSCGGPMTLRSSEYGLYYRCVDEHCANTLGATKDGRPLGEPADRETRALRKECHDAFDELWRTGTMTRPDAYRMLRTRLGLSEEACHFGLMEKEILGDAIGEIEEMRRLFLTDDMPF